MQAVLFSFSNRGGQLSVAVGKFLEVLGYEAECYTLPKFADADESLIAWCLLALRALRCAPLRRLLKAKPPTRRCLLSTSRQIL